MYSFGEKSKKELDGVHPGDRGLSIQPTPAGVIAAMPQLVIPQA